MPFAQWEYEPVLLIFKDESSSIRSHSDNANKIYAMEKYDDGHK